MFKMKKNLIYAIMVVMMAVCNILPAWSQVRFGVRGGLTLGELRFDRDIIDSDNRMGYCGGLLLDFNIPVVGVGAEVSVMYTHRNNRMTDHDRIFKRHYIDIPVYARYRLGLKSLDHIFAPLIFTGPSFSVLFNENAPSNYSNCKTYLSWDVGAGMDLFKHLRLTATYGIGMSKAMKYIDREYDGEQVSGKDRYWTISAAYLF